MPKNNYGAIQSTLDDDQVSVTSKSSVSTTATAMTSSSALHRLFRKGRRSRRARSVEAQRIDIQDDGDLSEDSGCCDDEICSRDVSDKAENGKKLLDLNSIIDMCTIKLKIPPPNTTEHDEEEGVGRRNVCNIDNRGVNKATKTLGAGLSLMKKGSRAAVSVVKDSATIAKNHASLLIPKGAAHNVKDETKKPNVCVVLCWKATCCVCLQISYPIRLFWGNTVFRVALVPVLLIFTWVFAYTTFSKFILKDLILPFVALGLSALAIVVQSWIVAFPMAAGISSILSQLQAIIEVAFDEMVRVVPRKIAQLFLVLKVPAAAADNLCRVLFIPFGEVLGTIFKIIPRVDDLVPPRVKDPRYLAPLVFAALLVALVLGQILLLLTMGSMVNGTVEVLLGFVISVVLAVLALYADQIVPLLLQFVEFLLNTIIQGLLRKLLPIAKLQKTIDYTERLIPKAKLPQRKKNKGNHKKKNTSALSTANDHTVSRATNAC